MPAGKWKLYDFAKEYIGEGTLDLDDSTNWKMALFQSTSNADTLSVGTGVFANLTNEHAGANGYAAGGIALTNVAWSRSGGSVKFDCDNAQWLAAGGPISARYAVIYKNATVNAIVKPILCVCVLDTTPSDVTATDGNTLTITIHANGVFTLSGADVN